MSATKVRSVEIDARDDFDRLTLELHDVECLADLLDALGTAPVGDGCTGIASEPLMRGIGAIGRVILEKSEPHQGERPIRAGGRTNAIVRFTMIAATYARRCALR